ncbi:PD-(D/E)XK motif protein [Pedobacter frigiditerrae]|uniref:PD-(D/E)XK motif protein n=1 Tax=Pedobacter frigiditerrae TaxID=2530452 RepID=UPI00292DDC89|nr:PD-(D/E)XK motif protein [Pedobacter frigiditerrae]
MTIEQLTSQWAKVEALEPLDSGFRSIRISSESIPDIYLATDRTDCRTLILVCPENRDFKFKGIFKENLSIDFYQESNHVVVKLANPEFNDLFNDLVISLYHKVCDMESQDEYVNEFIKSFYRWSGFFTALDMQGLSDEMIKGLFGELVLLREMISQTSPVDIDLILESWKGPFDARNDFELQGRFIEVKTKAGSKNKINISSEFQLETTDDNDLELCIISVNQDYLIGISLSQLISTLRTLVWDKNGDFSILVKALAQKGLLGDGLVRYEHLRFVVEKIETYDCLHEDFPKITPSMLPSGIAEVSYSLDVRQLFNFKTSERYM